MAQQGPNPIDVTDLKFKLHSKFKVFSSDTMKFRNGVDLIATASTLGIVIVGSSDGCLLVLPLTSIEHASTTEQSIQHLKVVLPGAPHQIALSCDNTFLAVDVDVNGMPFLLIYSVQSFLSQSVEITHNIKLSSEPNVRTRQIQWNPVLSSYLAVTLTNGAMASYTLLETGVDMHLLDKSEQAISLSWSPKGKQILVGSVNGKLMQFKPDLKLTRTIPCPENVFHHDFLVIAVHWLFNYQYAAVFLANDPQATPSFHIINAPKSGTPNYIKYDDICYSQNGPRAGQVFLLNIPQWNILLMASANSMEVGIMGFLEASEHPMWVQWITADEARAELPLTAYREETFPIGFCLETGCTVQVSFGESKLPLMPMIHLLSTHGYIVSFNLLNLTPKYVDICSPPRPLPDQLKWMPTELVTEEQPKPCEISFILPTGATSTPSAVKSKAFFTPPEASKTTTTSLFAGDVTSKSTSHPPMNSETKSVFGGAQTQSPTLFGSGNQSVFGGSSLVQPISTFQKQTTTTSLVQPAPISNNPPKTEPMKPLISVAPIYNKPKSSQKIETSMLQLDPITTASTKSSADDSDEIYQFMISEHIQTFDFEIRHILARIKNTKINIGTAEESQKITKVVGELQELCKTATRELDELRSEIHYLKQDFVDTFAMVSEANYKYSCITDPEYVHWQEKGAKKLTSHRQLSKLQALLHTVDMQCNDVNKQIYTNWLNSDDGRKENRKNLLRVPSLEIIYQILYKQKDIIAQHRNTLHRLKQKLRINANVLATPKAQDIAIESLTDSIISMSMADQVKFENSRLTTVKMFGLRETLKDRKVVIIPSIRPERKEVSSEVIREKKASIAREKAKKDEAKKNTLAKVALHQTQQEPEQLENSFNSTVHSAFGPGSTSKVTVPPKLNFIGDQSQNAPSFVGISKNTVGAVQPTFVDKPVDSVGMRTTSFKQSLPSEKSTIAKMQAKLPASVTLTSLPQSPVESPFPNQSESASPFTAFSKTVASKPKIEPSLNVSAKELETVKSSSSAFSSSTSKAAFTIPTTTLASPFSFSVASETKNIFGGGGSTFKIPLSMTIEPISSFATDSLQEPLKVESKSTPKTSFASSAENTSVSFSFKVVDPTNTTTSAGSGITPVATSASKSSFGSLSLSPATTSTAASVVPKSTGSSFSFGSAFAEAAKVTTPLPNFTPPPNVAVSAAVKSKAPVIDSTDNLLQGLNICKPSTTESKFSKPENIFGTAEAATITSLPSSTAQSTPFTTTASITAFGGLATKPEDTPAISKPSIFGGQMNATITSMPQTETVPTVTTLISSQFGQTPVTTSTNASVFGGAMTTSQSPFGSGGMSSFDNIEKTTVSTGNIFSQAAAKSPISFGPPDSSNSGGSIFSGGSLSTNTGGSFFGSSPVASLSTTASIFSQSVFVSSSAPSTVQPGASIFGGGAAISGEKPVSIFGAPVVSSAPSPFGFSAASPTTASSGGSLFGSAFGAAPQNNTSSIFGGGQSNQTSAFGGVTSTSVFGETSPNPQSSIFGGGGGASAFSSPQSTFGAPSTFGQQQTGFGASSSSPNSFQQSSSAFGAAPAFGGPATFGSSAPVFGGQTAFGSPTFGGAPTFQSPTKSAFGSAFGTPPQQQPSLFQSPQQSNQLFEQLGSSENAMTFGNLAQTANSNQSTKPNFGGGSSFSSWR